MSVVRSGLVRAVAAALVLALVVYVAATTLSDAWVRSQEVPTSGRARLPEVLYNAPASVATTDRRGPVGPTAVVFAGTQVLDGLVGELADPWIAVSSRTGDYRAVSGPELPPAAPGAVMVAPDGDLLAWAADDVVVLHDTLTGRSRSLEVPAAGAVGAFSPDGGRLLVHAGGQLGVLDVDSGDLTPLGDVPPQAVAGAVWRPDGEAVSLVDTGLAEIDVASGRRTVSDVRLAADAQLAWAPSGTRLVSLQELSGARRLQVWQRTPDGRVTAAVTVPTEGISLARLLGFYSDDTVAVVGLALETGGIQHVFEVPVEGARSVAEIGQLPSRGDNWIGAETLAVASGALQGGTKAFEEPRWPWSHRAKLVSSLVVALFALGMYLTRRPRRRPPRIK
ncbi:MAG TPA: hypothetical protein VFV40_10275 [Nocardioides sp.]|nr:hypothetical protein [Nocardioides sp.]